jgi:hypothetical protein
MKNEKQYNEYVETCKKKRIYPLSYYLWVENELNRMQKPNAMEIGFDLKTNFTGKCNGIAFSTSEGEQLS